VSNTSSANSLLFYGERGRAVAPTIFLNGKELSALTNEPTNITEPTSTSETSADGSADGSNNSVPGAQDLDDDFAFYTMDMIQRIKIEKLMRTTIGGPPTVGYLVSIFTKPDALIWKQSDKIVGTMNGYYESRVFYSPVYPQSGDKQDLRPTVFWQPTLSTNENGEATVIYYNPDPKNKIRIVAEGISERGVPLVGVSSYNIK
jgi:hypothetical protein